MVSRNSIYGHPAPAPRPRKRTFGRLPRLLALVFLSALAFYALLRWSGHFLVRNDAFERVSWVVVLEGQSYMLERSEWAAEMLRAGQVDSVVVCGSPVFRDQNAGYYYIQEMLRKGDVDGSRIYLLRHNDRSTLEEAYSLIEPLRARGADTVLLLTANAATRRAAMIFNHLAQGNPFFLVQDIGDAYFQPDTWYQSREARKTWLKEWLSLLYGWLELSWIPSLEEAPAKHLVWEPWNSVRSPRNESPDILLRSMSSEASVPTLVVDALPLDSAIRDSIRAKGSSEADSSAAPRDSTPQ